MDEPAADLEGYLGHIGYTGPKEPVLSTLASLQLRHTLTLPFENLDPLLKRPVRLDLPSLQDKFLRQGRGGYCYEHNLLLRSMLLAMGFTVTGLSARVLWNAAPETPRPRTHMLLRVDLPDGPYLVDVGFGAMTPTAPLRLAPGEVQHTPHEDFRVVQDGNLLRLEGRVRDAWKPVYAFDLQPQQPADYEPPSWYVSTHPSSHFVQVLMAARVTPDGRHVLQGNQLGYHPLKGASTHRPLESGPALRDALQGIFGIRLPQSPDLDERLAGQIRA